MARQIIPAYCNFGLTTSSTGFGVFTAATAADAVNGLCQAIMPTGGTFKKLRFRLATAPGAGCSWTLALCVNGTNSALSVTVSDAATEGTIETDVAVSAGDLVRYTITKSGTAANLNFIGALEFEPTTPGDNVYGFGSSAGNGSTEYSALIYGQDFDSSDSLYTAVCAGTITRMDINMADGVFPFSTTPGSGNSLTYAIELNGVLQDGAGGTVNTTIACANATNTGSATFSLAVSAGDVLRVKCVSVGSPGVRPPAGTLLFQSTSQLFAMCGVGSGLTTTPTYEYLVGSRAAGLGSGYHWDGTEADRQMVMTSPFTATGLIIGISSAETWAAGDSLTVTLRQNGVDSALTATITNPTRTISVAGSVGIAAGDLLSFRGTANNGRTPAVWASLVGTGTTTAKDGCLVAGVNTTIKATRAISFGLDGDTHEDTADGTFTVHGVTVLDGDLEVTGTVTGIASGMTELTGDVTAGPGSGSQAATIANDAVTYAKMQNVSAASKLLGRGSASGAGDPEEITVGSGLTMTGTTLTASASAPALDDVTDVTITSPADGDVLTYSSGSPAGWVNAAPSGGGGSGALVLLEQHTASGSASLDFTSWYSSTYDDYLIRFVGIAPATDDVDLCAQISSDGGTTWSSSAVYQIIELAFRASTNYNEAGAANSGTFFGLAGNLGNDSIGALVGELAMYAPGDGTVYPTLCGELNFFHSSLNRCFTSRSFTYGASVAVNAIKFFFSSGNIARGTIRIYGIVK